MVLPSPLSVGSIQLSTFPLSTPGLKVGKGVWEPPQWHVHNSQLNWLFTTASHPSVFAWLFRFCTPQCSLQTVSSVEIFWAHKSYFTQWGRLTLQESAGLHCWLRVYIYEAMNSLQQPRRIRAWLLSWGKSGISMLNTLQRWPQLEGILGLKPTKSFSRAGALWSLCSATNCLEKPGQELPHFLTISKSVALFVSTLSFSLYSAKPKKLLPLFLSTINLFIFIPMLFSS